MVFKGENISAPPSQEIITAAGIMAVYEKMNFDAVAVGPTDLAAGTDFLLTHSPSGFPWISANLLDRDQEPLFQPFLIKKKGDLQVGIIGLTDIVPLNNKENHIVSWKEVLPSLMESLVEKCDVILLLSSLDKKDNRTIALQFPQLHILISADRRIGNMVPKIVNNTLITQTKKQGKYLGHITCKLGTSGEWREFEPDKRKPLQKTLTILEEKIANIKKNQSFEYEQKEKLLTSLRKQHQRIQTQLEKLDEDLQLQQTLTTYDSSYSYSFIALRKNMPENKEINSIVSSIKKQIKVFNKSRRNTTEKDRVQLQQATGNLAGYTACQACHETQTAFWKLTDHYQSYSTLVTKGQAYNLDCLPCHVTHHSDQLNKDTIGREILLSLSPSLLVVGCESCHGPGLHHSESPEEVQPQKGARSSICISCHTKEHDSHFDFPKKLMRVRCPSNK